MLPHMRSVRVFLSPLVALLASACVRSGGESGVPAGEKTSMTIQVTSTVFEAGQAIPARHTCSGDDVSPPLAWSGVPSQAKSLALVCDDPDAPAGTWVHWVVYGIPPSATAFPEGVAKRDTLADGTRQGTNDFRRIGYGGPCPPLGKPHRYFFKLYALDMAPALAPGATKRDLMSAIEGHILAQGELMGTFKR